MFFYGLKGLALHEMNHYGKTTVFVYSKERMLKCPVPVLFLVWLIQCAYYETCYMTTYIGLICELHLFNHHMPNRYPENCRKASRHFPHVHVNRYSWEWFETINKLMCYVLLYTDYYFYQRQKFQRARDIGLHWLFTQIEGEPMHTSHVCIFVCTCRWFHTGYCIRRKRELYRCGMYMYYYRGSLLHVASLTCWIYLGSEWGKPRYEPII